MNSAPAPAGSGPAGEPQPANRAGELAATTPSASIPFRPSDNAVLPTGGATVLGSLLVLALVGGALVILKRRAFSYRRLGDPRLLEVTERCSLTPGIHLIVTRYAGRRLLLSVGPAGTQVLRDDAEKDAL